jgi:hypothetical protein
MRYNEKMNADDVKFYRERWKAFKKIQQQELRAMSLDEHWRQINMLARIAIQMGWNRNDDDGKMEVYLRWAKLKEKYESGKT